MRQSPIQLFGKTDSSSGAAWVCHTGPERTGSVLEITGTNPAQSARRGPGTGHGITGMRERAEAAGGTLTASPGLDGTYERRGAFRLLIDAEPPA